MTAREDKRNILERRGSWQLNHRQRCCRFVTGWLQIRLTVPFHWRKSLFFLAVLLTQVKEISSLKSRFCAVKRLCSQLSRHLPGACERVHTPSQGNELFKRQKYLPGAASMLKNQQMQELWLDRVWIYLFGDSGGLITPGQIRREGLERARVRQAELAAIETTERELADLRSGRKVVGYGGQVVDAVAVGDVPMYGFIEQPAVDEDRIFAHLTKPQNLFDSVAHEVSQRDVERSLNIRRIALLVEEEILNSYTLQPLSDREVGAHWLQRWRQWAQDIHYPQLQRLWARLLAREVAAPGRYSLATVETLGAIGERDIAGIQLLARYVFGEFIFDARGRYFQPQLHDIWLQGAETLGLLHSIETQRVVNLHSQLGDEQEPLLLINHRRALQLSALNSNGVSLPVLRLTAIGKQIFHLCGGEADMAYLLDLAAYLAEQGVKVALGEWHSLRRHFEKKIDYS
jgi:hypothetical protein